ncbi:hypothetical protein ACLKA6_015082 [Drosophila palustris]
MKNVTGHTRAVECQVEGPSQHHHHLQHHRQQKFINLSVQVSDGWVRFEFEFKTGTPVPYPESSTRVAGVAKATTLGHLDTWLPLTMMSLRHSEPELD